MKKENFAKAEELEIVEAPKDSDDAFLQQCEFENHIQKASSWLQKHIIARIHDIAEQSAWYRRHEGERPKKRLGECLETTNGKLCERYRYYVQMLRKYRQGRSPLGIIYKDYRCTSIYLERVKKLLKDHTNVLIARRKLNEAWNLVRERENPMDSHAEYLRELDKIVDELFAAIAAIGDQFAKIDAEDDGEVPSSEPVSKEELKKATEEVKATVKDHSAEIKEEVKDKVEEEGEKTRRKVVTTGKKVVKDVTEKKSSDYEKRGPKGNARKRQFSGVVEQMRGFAADPGKLPKDLRGKSPEKWIRFACSQAWEKVDGGYPSVDALYKYCKSNQEVLLSLAGL